MICQKKVLLIFIIFVGFIFLFSNHSFAAPAIWEPDFGPAIDDLTGEDDDEASVGNYSSQSSSSSSPEYFDQELFDKNLLDQH